MALSVRLQAEPTNEYVPDVCSTCRGKGRILYPFPGEPADYPLGGVKIKSVSCLDCGGRGQGLATDAVATMAARQ